MSKQFKSVAEVAASLVDEPAVKEEVETAILKSRMVTALLSLRVQKKYTQKQIAEAMQCDASKISKLESGDDVSLKWADIAGYLAAMGMKMHIFLDDDNLPAAERIKQHVFRIHDLLENLADLAKEVDGDTEITDKIHQFYGEVLFNFITRFGDSYAKLASVIEMPECEVPKSLLGRDRGQKEDVDVTESVTH